MSNMKNIKIVSAGHICLDITPGFLNAGNESISTLLAPGCLLETGNVDVHIGGSVANTGIGLKILGADVSLMGKLGNDAFGLIVQEQIRQYVSAQYMSISDFSSTSYSIVIAPRGIDRMFLHHPGANDEFTSEDLCYEEIGKADLFHFGYPPLMKRMFADHGTELEKMFRKVKQLNVPISLDMASVDENSASGQADWRAILKRILPYVDFFVPSVEELAFMIRPSLYREWTKQAAGQDITTVICQEEVQSLAEELLSFGAKIVLIKCGVPGLFLAAGNHEKMEALSRITGSNMSRWADVRHFEHSYKPEKVVSATGAGDTTIAAFLYSVMNRYSWQQCLRYAAGEGASCVETYDAVSGLRTLEELQQRIDAGWEKR